MDRKEIEASLAKCGDYVKIDFLIRVLKQQGLDIDTKKFAMLKLSGIYEERKMFLEAARFMRLVSDFEPTDLSKINDLVKSGQLYISGGALDDADVSFSKAIAYAFSEQQKLKIKQTRIDTYKIQAKLYLAREKRKHAMEVYERLIRSEMPADEKKAIQNELLVLYNKLGKVDDYFELKRKM